MKNEKQRRTIWGEFDKDGNEFVYGYMCLIDYECELGGASGGNVIYPSKENLLENHKIAESSCGYARVRVYLDEVIKESSYGQDDKKSSIS